MDASRLRLVRAGSIADDNLMSEGRQAERIRLELNRVLNSAHFDASERNRRFIHYVVEETLLGRADRIKAYTIATVVFGRDDNFDPTLDPVVRMEARRLRRSLERFYLVEGEDGPIRIALPKGGYVPQFLPAGIEITNDDLGHADYTRFPIRKPSVFVSAFELEYSHRPDVSLCDGLARQIVIHLMRFPELAVFMQCLTGGSRFPPDAPSGKAEVDFVLAGNVAAGTHFLKVKTTLLDARTGRVVEAQTFIGDTTSADLLDERDRLADQIAGLLSDSVAAHHRLGGH